MYVFRAKFYSLEIYLSVAHHCRARLFWERAKFIKDFFFKKNRRKYIKKKNNLKRFFVVVFCFTHNYSVLGMNTQKKIKINKDLDGSFSYNTATGFYSKGVPMPAPKSS